MSKEKILELLQQLQFFLHVGCRFCYQISVI